MKMNDSGNIFTQFFAWVAALASAIGFTTQDLVFMFFGAAGLLISLASYINGRVAVHDMPVTPRTIDLGLRCRTYSGVYQINVVAPAGSGRTSVVALADRVAELFPEGQEIEGRGFTCWIDQTSGVFRGITTSVSYTVPVSLNYRADISS
ncbi:phage tail terminator-like protein [Enterobacter bugandensis]|uniref:phage tail terminator-like protein n=1 Tax=Enterobacter bugandensis TaxID=881260 RepID=UPI0018A5C99B|nr:phage tail terminator-like protein [Enterobacter bugandensis]BBW27154.1 hypothetical protein STN0717ENT56_23100 [Enterobacter bugandensis]